MRRRKFFAGASVGIIISVSGCLESNPLVEQTGNPDGTDEDTSDDGTDEDTSDDGADDEYEYQAVEGEHEFSGGTFTIKQFGEDQRSLHRDFQYALEYFADAQRALNYFESDPLTEELRAFITETDFSQERLLFIWTKGGDPGYSDVMIRSFSLTDETLAGRAAAYADKLIGADSVSYPAAFIRVTFDEEPVETAEFTLVGGVYRDEEKHIGNGPEYAREASTQNE